MHDNPHPARDASLCSKILFHHPLFLHPVRDATIGLLVASLRDAKMIWEILLCYRAMHLSEMRNNLHYYYIKKSTNQENRPIFTELLLIITHICSNKKLNSLVHPYYFSNTIASGRIAPARICVFGFSKTYLPMY